jgi:hypothetical protein
VHTFEQLPASDGRLSANALVAPFCTDP